MDYVYIWGMGNDDVINFFFKVLFFYNSCKYVIKNSPFWTDQCGLPNCTGIDRNGAKYSTVQYKWTEMEHNEAHECGSQKK